MQLFIYVYSQNIEQHLPFSIQSFSTKNGLSQNQVLTFEEGDQGVFVSTVNDVMLFDGASFENVNSSTRTFVQKQLHYDFVSKSLYGYKLNSGVIKITPKYQEVILCNAVHYENKQYTIITKSGEIEVYNYKQQLLAKYNTRLINAATVLVNGEKHIYFNSGNELYAFNKQTNDLKVIYKGVIHHIAKNPFTNQIYILGDEVMVAHQVTVSKLPIKTTEYTDFKDISFISTDEFIIGSSNGLYHKFGEKILNYTMKDGLNSNSIYSVFYYKIENQLFVGTENNGCMLLQKKRAKTYLIPTTKNGSQSFASVIQDKENTIYSTAYKGNIIAIKNQQQFPYIQLDEHVISLENDNDTIYAGTWGDGIKVYHKTKLLGSIPMKTLTIPVVYFTKKINGELWIGTNQGLYRKNKDIHWESKPLNKDKMISFYQLRNKAIVIGGDNGIYFYRENGTLIKHLPNSNQRFGREVRSFYEDAENRLWIGTYDGGIYCYDKGKLTSINQLKNNMLCQDAFTLIKHPNGLIYITSNNGLWAINEQKLIDFYEKKIDYLIPFHFSESSGILNPEFNGGFSNNYAILNNYLYLPSIFGLNEFNTEIPLTQRKNSVQLKKVIANDSIEITDAYFKQNTYNIQITFSTQNFNEENNQYIQYSIKRNNKTQLNWSKLQKVQQIELKMLPPGQYTLTIRALDAFNDSNPIETYYSFTIETPFNQSIAYYVLIFIFISGIVYLLAIMRLKSIRYKYKVNNTIQDLKIKSIDSRLNPHFMYNTLNSIIYFMAIEKYNEAEEQLQDFSRLLRLYLEKTDSNFIHIEEEVRMLHLYLAIQQKRYNNEFEYRIDYSDTLHRKMIPTMFIQPFVENSIIHGLAHKNEKGHLNIHFEIHGKNLRVVIEDDGIGRTKSTEINQHRTLHQSKGTELIKAKIETLKNKFNLKIEIKFIDINELENNGTIVEITFFDYEKMCDY